VNVKVAQGKLKDWVLSNPRPKKCNPEFKQEKAAPKPKLPKTAVQAAGELDGEQFDDEEWMDDEE